MIRLNNFLNRFWKWYEDHYRLNLTIATVLFLWQLVHLYWLTTNVVILKLFGINFSHFEGIWRYLIIIVDYTEIPALITTSLFYANSLRRGFEFKSVLFLILLNSQWLHLFWITDEFVISQFTTKNPTLSIWLAWLAILIDYLEIPVIFDTTRKLLTFKKRTFNGPIK